ncbi:MAG: hypothetical protein ACE5EM_12540 [Sphingomonadales bacterium]
MTTLGFEAMLPAFPANISKKKPAAPTGRRAIWKSVLIEGPVKLVGERGFLFGRELLWKVLNQ